MTCIEKECFKELDLYESPTINLSEWMTRNKFYAILLILCFLINLPFYIGVHILIAICFHFHALYEKLDEYISD